jgi:hypothetical protein
MNTLNSEPENTVNQTQEVVKRGRGRPPKPKTESSQSISPNRDSEVKKSRGRPAKYAPEERKEKYLEKIKNWQEENADKVKEYNHKWRQDHYEEYKKINSEGQKKRMERLISAYKILQKVWGNDNITNLLSEEDKQSMNLIFNSRQIEIN